LLKNEHLVAENRILKTKVNGDWVLSEGEKATLAEFAHPLGLAGSGLDCATGYDFGLVSKTDRAEV
jgi:hypothetical protein